MIHITLMTISASVIAFLGGAHLLLTFVGPKLQPREPEVRRLMEQSSPVITGQTTMWKAWLGFNASHSIGALLFGFVYGYLALAHAQVLFASQALLAAGMLTLVAYLVLAVRYWFVNPLIAISISCACYSMSIIMAWV